MFLSQLTVFSIRVFLTFTILQLLELVYLEISCLFNLLCMKLWINESYIFESLFAYLFNNFLNKYFEKDKFSGNKEFKA